MYTFIPSWYGKEGSWVRDARPWHRAGEQMEFDDAVNQIKMFQMAGEDVQIILLSCIPDLRYFLHRERVDDIKVWSAFDYIQNVKGDTAQPVKLRHYGWPEDIEWFHTPFLMIGYRNGKIYAKAEFSEEGWWISAEFHEDGVPARKIHLDDRGFVSYREFCRKGEPVWREFYDREGRWQIKEDIKRKNVYVNPEFSHRFDRSSYENIGQLIEEVLLKHLGRNTDGPLIVAFDEQHNDIVRRAAGGRKTAYSVFSQRTGNPAPSIFESLIREDSLLVTDTEFLADGIRRMFPQYAGRILDLSPYDARLSLGKSAGIRELKILLYLDRDRFEEYKGALGSIFAYMKENRNAFLTVGTGRHFSSHYAGEYARMQLEVFMEAAGVHYRIEDDSKNIAENEAEEEAESRIAIRELKSETQIIEALSDHRVIIDLSDTPDLYLQIAGISAGLPIILRAKTQYVSHKENGWILKSDALEGKSVPEKAGSEEDELADALRYYLRGLANWNRSLIWSLRRISAYTNGNIVDRWKKAMDNPSNGGKRS